MVKLAKLKSLSKYTVYAVALLVGILLFYREMRLSAIPAAEKRIPFRLEEEEVPTPKRPGTRSIRIVGPPIKTLRFELDFRRQPRPLNWRYLERIDKRADVMLEGFVDAEGLFVINRVNDRGHPKAGRYIREILGTWRFMPYKTGRIRYYFNVPTNMEHMKVQIDLRALQKNKRYVGLYDEVEDGMIYFFEGIDQNNVMMIN